MPPDLTPPDLKVVAVVGCQRSGTSLTGQILGAHPQALLIDEEDGLYDWFHAWAAGGSDASKLFAAVIDRARQKYARPQLRFEQARDGAWRPARGVTHLVLKAPNLTYAWAALAALPTSVSVAYPVRDPRSVVASMGRLSGIPMVENQARLLRRHQALAREFAAELELLDSAGTPVEVRRAMVWRIKSSLQPRFEAAGLSLFGFRYEDLVSDKEAICRRLAEVVGLGFDPELLVHEQSYTDIGPGLAVRFRPVDRLSIRRWEDELSAPQAAAILRTAGEPAIRFGYVEQSDVPRPRRDPGIPDWVLRAPVILTGRGGSGTRLLSDLAGGCGVFLGNHVTASGDGMEWVNLIYQMAVDWLANGRSDPERFRSAWDAALIGRAREVLSAGAWRPPAPWGWKLPETMIVAQTLCQVFNRSRLIHLVRHPVTSAFRRAHVTSRASNPVGNAVLVHAYREAGRDPASIPGEPIHMRNALTWLFQVRSVMRLGREDLGPSRYLELRFEDIGRDPRAAAGRVAAFCGATAIGPLPAVDAARASKLKADPSEIAQVWALCAEAAEALGYGPDLPAAVDMTVS